MTRDENAQAILRAHTADFATLARIAGLDPKRHFRGADWRNVDFGDDDLTGFDFAEADFVGADLMRARGLRPEMFVGARFDATTKAPPGLFGPAKPEWAASNGTDQYGAFVTIEVPMQRGNPVVQRLRWIPPGSFWMGTPNDEQGRDQEEGPRHEVTIFDGFWLFDTPCTQAMWRAVMGSNPSKFKSPDRPVERVSFEDVQLFLVKLNTVLPGFAGVLPSEAQWEYACRAGTETATFAGALEILGEFNAPVLDAIAWYGGNSGIEFELKNGKDSSVWPEKQFEHARAGTHPVARKRPNNWGLYDMLGNVFELVEDTYASYMVEPQDKSLHAASRPFRVVRGGSWNDSARWLRSGCRLDIGPGFRSDDFGFRVARPLTS